MLTPKITIAIVDDHPVVIEGLVRLLSKNPDFEIVKSFTSGKTFLNFLEKKAIDIVLLDLILPDINGMDLCKNIKNIAPNTMVLAFSNHRERSAIMQMLANGASGYVLKDASVDEIMNCIYGAIKGQASFSRMVNEIIARPALNQQQDIAKLTIREREILKLIATGENSGSIAELLFLSKFTVENHRKNLMQKLKAKNVADLIRIATQQQLL